MTHPTLFGDDDPEDAWDEHDPAPVRLVILVRMLGHVWAEARHPDHDHARAVVRLAFAIAAINRLRQLRDASLEPVLVALLLGFVLLQAQEGP